LEAVLLFLRKEWEYLNRHKNPQHPFPDGWMLREDMYVRPVDGDAIDGSDSGIFSVSMAELITDDLPLTLLNGSMSLLRRRMVLNIMNEKLHYQHPKRQHRILIRPEGIVSTHISQSSGDEEDLDDEEDIKMSNDKEVIRERCSDCLDQTFTLFRATKLWQLMGNNFTDREVSDNVCKNWNQMAFEYVRNERSKHYIQTKWVSLINCVNVNVLSDLKTNDSCNNALFRLEEATLLFHLMGGSFEDLIVSDEVCESWNTKKSKGAKIKNKTYLQNKWNALLSCDKN
jgi:hypothetical protein